MQILDPSALEAIGEPHRDRHLLTEHRQRVLDRARFLLPRDRQMVEAVVSGRLSCGQVAAMRGVALATVSRRVKALGNRLCEPLVVALLDERCPLAPDVRQLGIEFFVQGQTTVALADVHRMSRIEVRRFIDFIRGWHRGMVRQSATR